MAGSTSGDNLESLSIFELIVMTTTTVPQQSVDTLLLDLTVRSFLEEVVTLG
jgi:hypothetical protein